MCLIKFSQSFVSGSEDMQVREFYKESCDIFVIGAGHAGIEAALASARMGHKTIIMTISLDAIAQLSCNPNIGGTGKGHLVREIDALGGEMAINIDKAYIQSRMLNTSKGPAVHSLRVQADKSVYHREMKKVLENEENLKLIQGEIKKIIVEDGRVKGVISTTGAIYTAAAVVVATGTYLNGRVFLGEYNYESGPDGRFPSRSLSTSLKELNINLRRLKTGTPARIARKSVDFSKMTVQKGDDDFTPFSFINEGLELERNEPCYLTYTTKKMHDYILANLDRSAKASGDIVGDGPRYCPSIEDKLIRFQDKEKHQVFIEPEGLDTQEMYVQGVSTTLPEEMQIEMYRMIEGLENAEIMRDAYAIEYDAVDANELSLSLEHKKIKNLFFAGQINGSSGYEEAAAQGIIAGINAALKIEEREAFILKRSEAYIGVLIDDLVTKQTHEPYRMMTSRCEYRLSLRQDNADLRLTEKSYKIGLANKERYEKMLKKKKNIEDEIARLEKTKINPNYENNKILLEAGSAEIKNAISLKELIRRPEISYDVLKKFSLQNEKLTREEKSEVETEIKYEGYIQKQAKEIERFKKMEERSLEGLDYDDVKGLKKEAAEKLKKIEPKNVGQASRIAGVTPADINTILIYLELLRRKK